MLNSNGTIVGWQAAAAFTGRSIASLRRAVADGEIAASKDGEGRYIFAREALAPLRAQRDLPATSPSNGHGANSDGRGPAPRSSQAAVPRLDDLELAIFGDLARGADPGEVALVHGVDPDWLRRRAAAWRRLTVAESGAFARRLDEIEGIVAALTEENRQLGARVAHLEAEHAVALRMIRQSIIAIAQ